MGHIGSFGVASPAEHLSLISLPSGGPSASCIIQCIGLVGALMFLPTLQS